MADLTGLETGLMASLAAILAAVLAFFTGTKKKVSIEDCQRLHAAQSEECKRRHDADDKVMKVLVDAITERLERIERKLDALSGFSK